MSTEPTPPPPPVPRPRPRLLDAALLLGIVGVLALVGVAFAYPWLPRPVGGAALARYAPLRDGDAILLVKQGPDGATLSWQSQNRALANGLRIATDLRPAAGTAIRSEQRR